MLASVCTLMPDKNGNVASRRDAQAHLNRWTMNLKSNTISSSKIDTLTGEFPRFDERFNGYQYNHLYMGANPNIENLFDRIVHYNLLSGNRQDHIFNESIPSEPIFTPRSGNEGDGYL